MVMTTVIARTAEQDEATERAMREEVPSPPTEDEMSKGVSRPSGRDRGEANLNPLSLRPRAQRGGSNLILTELLGKSKVW